MRTLLVASALAALAGCHRHEPFGSLTVTEVAAKRGQPNTFVFDNNTPERFRRGHVPGAKWVNPGRVSVADLPADKEATLIFYCANSH